MERDRDQRGQYADGFKARDALAVFAERDDQARPVTANDIKEELGWTRGTVHNKLGRLVERGILETRKIGSRGRVWWAPISRDLVPLSSMKLSDVETPTSPEEILESAGEAIPGRTEEDRQQRAAAVLTAYEFLQQQGQAQIAEIQEYTYEKHPLEDETKNQSAATRQWVNYLRDGLRKLPGVEGGEVSRSGTWNYVDPGGELAQALDVELEDWVKEVEVTGEGTLADRQHAMIQLAYDYLKRDGPARREDFEEALPDYTAHYSGFEGLWGYCLRDALQNAPEVEVESEHGRYSTFKYAGGRGEPAADTEVRSATAADE